MRLWYCSALLVALAFLAACGEAPTAEDLPGRLDAAQAISDTATRNDALVRVARSAGELGAGEIALQAIRAISSTNLRSSTAAQVAVSLADGGDSMQASEVAKEIASTIQRNEILARIAGS